VRKDFTRILLSGMNVDVMILELVFVVVDKIVLMPVVQTKECWFSVAFYT
jgi:hypothetical protein